MASSTLHVALLIAGFGALGCLARYYSASWVNHVFGNAFPYGTLLVNLVGAFLIGFINELASRNDAISDETRIGVAVGFLGGLTTFSTFSYETFSLLKAGDTFTAFLNIMISVGVCLAFTWFGIVLAKQI
jgi:CrcB protein